MIRETRLTAGAAIGIVAAMLTFASPVEAGTCASIAGKARAADPATATTRAQIELVQKAARFGGKITNTSTNCIKSPPGYVCKMTAVVCPKKS
jgi:hypothetical protein